MSALLSAAEITAVFLNEKWHPDYDAADAQKYWAQRIQRASVSERELAILKEKAAETVSVT